MLIYLFIVSLLIFAFNVPINILAFDYCENLIPNRLPNALRSVDKGRSIEDGTGNT